jgi:hypothetical protein
MVKKPFIASAASHGRRLEKRDDGANPQLAFAVYHLAEMIFDLKRHYHAAYKGEIEP